MSNIKMPSVNYQHDYITIKFPNGNFTLSRSGYKASGDINNNVFNGLMRYFETVEGNIREKIENLFSSGVISQIYPNWDVKIEYDFKVDDEVVLNYKGQAHVGKIVKISKKNASVRFETLGLVGVPFGMLAKR